MLQAPAAADDSPHGVFGGFELDGDRANEPGCRSDVDDDDGDDDDDDLSLGAAAAARDVPDLRGASRNALCALCDAALSVGNAQEAYVVARSLLQRSNALSPRERTLVAAAYRAVVAPRRASWLTCTRLRADELRQRRSAAHAAALPVRDAAGHEDAEAGGAYDMSETRIREQAAQDVSQSLNSQNGISIGVSSGGQAGSRSVLALFPSLAAPRTLVAHKSSSSASDGGGGSREDSSSREDSRSSSSGNDAAAREGMHTEYSPVVTIAETVREELEDVCHELLGHLQDRLLPFAERAQNDADDDDDDGADGDAEEAAIFYHKLAGDFTRYLAEHTAERSAHTGAEAASAHYDEALRRAKASLFAAHPLLLGVALSAAVFLVEIRKTPEKACALAKEVHDAAVRALEEQAQERQEQSTPSGRMANREASMEAVERLRVNLTAWSQQTSAE